MPVFPIILAHAPAYALAPQSIRDAYDRVWTIYLYTLNFGQPMMGQTYQNGLLNLSSGNINQLTTRLRATADRILGIGGPRLTPDLAQYALNNYMFVYLGNKANADHYAYLAGFFVSATAYNSPTSMPVASRGLPVPNPT